jgi:ribonuclease D
MKKQFQRSDWRIRPLFTEMIRYASIDAEVLPYILLRMLKTEPNQNLVKQGFCKKRTMKSKGVRN